MARPKVLLLGEIEQYGSPFSTPTFSAVVIKKFSDFVPISRY